jgi:hypothetical protein
MKRAFNRILTLAAEFFAVLAACIGCSPKHGQAPPQRQIRWRAPETGFKSTTAIESDNASKANHEEGQ